MRIPAGEISYSLASDINDYTEQLMEVAQWWIMEMKLDHFEKAEKIKTLVQAMP